jgi:hypothetical protein
MAMESGIRAVFPAGINSDPFEGGKIVFRPVALIAATVTLASALPAQTGIAGRWTQSSSGKELVLAPKVKLQPNVGTSYGTSLGGSVGYRSMTRTTIVTEPTPMDVNRSMTLAIAADGAFKWTITKRHAEGASCTRTTSQVKQGRASLTGGKMVFAVSGGTESFGKSCGGRGSSAIAPARESYVAVMAGNQLRLSSDGQNWAFTRG